MSVSVWRMVGTLPAPASRRLGAERIPFVKARAAEESSSRLDSHLLIVDDKDHGLQLAINQETGGLGHGVWLNETLQLAPGLVVQGQPVVQETHPEDYLFTPERVARADTPPVMLAAPPAAISTSSSAAGISSAASAARSPITEVTLIARGVAVAAPGERVGDAGGSGAHPSEDAPDPPISGVGDVGQSNGARWPWALQLTYTYDELSGLLSVWLRPVVAETPTRVSTNVASRKEAQHTARVTATAKSTGTAKLVDTAIPSNVASAVRGRKHTVQVDASVQVRWNVPWAERCGRAARSPQGAWVIVPEQPGTSVAITNQTLTVHRNREGVDGSGEPLLILIWLPRSPLEAQSLPLTLSSLSAMSLMSSMSLTSSISSRLPSLSSPLWQLPSSSWPSSQSSSWLSSQSSSQPAPSMSPPQSRPSGLAVQPVPPTIPPAQSGLSPWGGPGSDHGLAVFTTAEQALGWLSLEPPAGWRVECGVIPAPAFAPIDEFRKLRPLPPGRYQLVWTLTPASQPGPKPRSQSQPQLEPSPQPDPSFRIALPFRLWPNAGQNRAQAEYAQLLLSSDLGDDFLVAYNFVQSRHIYRAEDRDDVLAETGRIAFTLGQTLGDPDLRWLAWKMADKLLAHQQPDGGFTFGVSVNGFRADYTDTDADVVQFLLALLAGEPPHSLRRHVWLQAAVRAGHFICTYQDAAGFFWGRIDRSDKHSYGEQPWFTSYSVVALLELAAQLQADAQENQDPDPGGDSHRFTSKGGVEVSESPQSQQSPEFWQSPQVLEFQHAAERGLDWLCQVQAEDGHMRFDTEGPYADYDDLSNTSVAVWALARAVELEPTHPHAARWWQAAQRGMEYLLGLELADRPGQFTGRQLAGLEKLVYDYRLGSAFEQYLRCVELRYAGHMESGEQGGRPAPAGQAARYAEAVVECTGDGGFVGRVRSAFERYLTHIRFIQGRGTIAGGWGSLYLAESQEYATHFDWFERGSAWQEYVFLGWQGKLILTLTRAETSRFRP